jgi:nucleoside-diphosphate-sugar epimerase
MKILITGCNGFIGKNMMSYLGHQPEWQVDGWDWTSDKHSWPSVMEYDWVIHLGAIADMTEKDVEKVMFQNFDFSCWLFSECQKHKVNFMHARYFTTCFTTLDL